MTWRPLTAIHEAAADGNPATSADPSWRPLINTPNYSDHPSGANNVVAAMTKTLELFFNGRKFAFVVTSNSPLAVEKTRTYRSFEAPRDDVVWARILQGIHFRYADEAGRVQGEDVATFVYRHALLPVRDHCPARKPIGPVATIE